VVAVLWAQSFYEIQRQQNLVARLLRGKIPLASPFGTLTDCAIARASNVLCTSPLKGAPKRRLLLQVPEANPSFARTLVLALIFSELAWRQRGTTDLIAIDGDLLFVTQHIVSCRQMLDSIRVGGTDGVTLRESYRIVSITGQPSVSGLRSLYLANPGRISDLADSNFGAVLIDASHPRTLAHLPNLLSSPSIANSQLQIIVTPPVHVDRHILTGNGSAWLWDPHSAHRLKTALGEDAPDAFELPCRHYWFACDQEVETLLYEVHCLLTGAMKHVRGQTPALLLQAWSVYNQLRNMSVELAYLERSIRRVGYEPPLCDKIKQLQKEENRLDGDLGIYLELSWHRIGVAFQQIYDLFSKRSETAKFYVVGEILSDHVSKTDDPIRIVTSSLKEALLLEERLDLLGGGFGDRVRHGLVRVVHQALEARLITEEGPRQTVLMGARSSAYRYLDLFPSETTHVVAYGYEGIADKKGLRRLYDWGESASSEQEKLRVLNILGICEEYQPTNEKISLYPPIEDHYEVRCSVERFADVEPEPLVLYWARSENGGIQRPVTHDSEQFISIGSTNSIELIDTEYRTIVYPRNKRVDVYYPETAKIRRIRAEEVRPGDYIVVLIDDYYEELFDRLRQAIAERRPKLETARLHRWYLAKRQLLRAFEYDCSAIWYSLHEQLTVGLKAVPYWFNEDKPEDDEGRGIAPLSFKDFALVATLSGVYSSEEDLRTTYEAIRNERANRKRWGRALRNVLKSIVNGSSYETAVQSAAVINTPVDEVLLAVEIREIFRVRPVEE